MVEPLDEWVYFLKNENILDTFTAQGLHEAKEKLEVLKLSEKKRKAYSTYQENLRYKRSMEETQYLAGYQKGQDFGYQKGQDSGYQNAQYELAKKLFNSSMDLDDQAISNLTALDLEVVKKLTDESKK